MQSFVNEKNLEERISDWTIAPRHYEQLLSIFKRLKRHAEPYADDQSDIDFSDTKNNPLQELLFRNIWEHMNGFFSRDYFASLCGLLQAKLDMPDLSIFTSRDNIVSEAVLGDKDYLYTLTETSFFPLNCHFNGTLMGEGLETELAQACIGLAYELDPDIGMLHICRGTKKLEREEAGLSYDLYQFYKNRIATVYIINSLANKEDPVWIIDHIATYRDENIKIPKERNQSLFERMTPQGLDASSNSIPLDWFILNGIDIAAAHGSVQRPSYLFFNAKNLFENSSKGVLHIADELAVRNRFDSVHRNMTKRLRSIGKRHDKDALRSYNMPIREHVLSFAENVNVSTHEPYGVRIEPKSIKEKNRELEHFVNQMIQSRDNSIRAKINSDPFTLSSDDWKDVSRAFDDFSAGQYTNGEVIHGMDWIVRHFPQFKKRFGSVRKSFIYGLLEYFHGSKGFSNGGKKQSNSTEIDKIIQAILSEKQTPRTIFGARDKIYTRSEFTPIKSIPYPWENKQADLSDVPQYISQFLALMFEKPGNNLYERALSLPDSKFILTFLKSDKRLTSELKSLLTRPDSIESVTHQPDASISKQPSTERERLQLLKYVSRYADETLFFSLWHHLLDTDFSYRQNASTRTHVLNWQKKLSQLTPHSTPFSELAVVSESRLFPINLIGSERRASCVFGPYGSNKKVSLLYELDPHIGFLNIVAINHESSSTQGFPLSEVTEYTDRIVGSAYVVECHSPKGFAWLIDGVDAGPLVDYSASDWREIFYHGLRNASRDSKLSRPPAAIYVNTNVTNQRNKDFIAFAEAQGKRINVFLEKIGGVDILRKYGIRPQHYLESFYHDTAEPGVWTSTCRGTVDAIELDKDFFTGPLSDDFFERLKKTPQLELPEGILL